LLSFLDCFAALAMTISNRLPDSVPAPFGRPSQPARPLSFMAWRLTFRCNMSQEIFT
jgi:hypothetical protein